MSNMGGDAGRTDIGVGMSSLSLLPIFARLAGRTVLIAGDRFEGLAWKLALVHASGARIRLRIPASVGVLSGDVVGLSGEIDVVRRDWSISDLDEVVLAVCDFADEAAASVLADACRSRRILLNVVDRPLWCDFQFGSIVDRSPLVVSISTDGVAPVLAQRVRQKIEAILPSGLSRWVCKAREVRRTLSSALPDQRARRVFWDRYVDSAFSSSVGSEDAMIEALIADGVRSGLGVGEEIGRVSLVGAGPGDADLLTVKAVRVLNQADVILHDDLVGDSVLELGRREAERIGVGKRGGVKRSCKQDEINALMLRLVGEGKHVVRLKSGDPSIFGRAGEEISLLSAAGVPVEIVPGVTAATAAAARLTVSLTHREGAPGVKFITAHSRHGRLPDLDWRAVADPKTTLVIYMGAGTARETAQALIAHGMSRRTPVIIATAVSRREEQFEYSTLSGLLSASIDRTHPVLICVGEVFARAVVGCGGAGWDDPEVSA